MLRERRAAEQRQGSTAADGVSRMQACHLSARYHTGNIVTHAAVRYTIIALIVLDCLLFLLEVCWLGRSTIRVHACTGERATPTFNQHVE